MTDLDDTRPRGPDQRVDPSADQDRRRCARDILAALDTLDVNSAAALRMVYFGQTTQTQAATRLGLAETEVRTLISRGLQHLSARIDAMPHREPALREATPGRLMHAPRRHRNN